MGAKCRFQPQVTRRNSIPQVTAFPSNSQRRSKYTIIVEGMPQHTTMRHPLKQEPDFFANVN